MGSSRYYDYKPEQSRIAIGYTFLARKFWGGQYNAAIKRLMLEHAFQFVDSVVFHIGPTNFRSQHAILKLGAMKIGEEEYNGIAQFVYEIRRIRY
jgi:RimJ/RimL family protein N-acetyltransferase